MKEEKAKILASVEQEEVVWRTRNSYENEG